MQREAPALGYEARAEVAELVGRYAHLADYGEVAEWASLFTEDGRVSRPGLALRGERELVDYLTRRRAEMTVRHQLFNVLVGGDAHEAHAVCYAQIVQVGSSPTPLLTARYRFRVRRTAGGWRIAEVRIEPDAPSAASASAAGPT